MSGSITGGKKAAATNRALYGDDFYHRIGKLGPPEREKPTGFASPNVGRDGLTGPERARLYARDSGKRLLGSKWSDAHRANFYKAQERRRGIGYDVDLTEIDLELKDVIWYLSPFSPLYN